MTDIFKTVLPVVIMLVIGIVARRTNMLSREGINALKRVVMDITLPAVLIGAFANAEYSVNSVLLPIIMFLACWLAMILGRVGKRALSISSPYAPYLTTGYEAGMLGYALFAMLYGQEHTASFALLDLGQVLFVFTVYKACVCREHGGRTTAGQTFISLVSSPTIWAITLGVILGATGIYKAMGQWREVFDGVTDFVSGPTGAIILLTIGYDLSIDFAQVKSAFRTIVMRVIVSAVIMAGMLAITGIMFPGDAYIRGAVLLMFILPPPYVLPILADDATQREYVSATLCSVTLITIICFSVLASI